MIYYILYKNAKSVKIGYTGNIWERVSALKHSIPDEIVLLGAHDGDTEDEKQIHSDLSGIRMKGEFFRLCDELVCYIEIWSPIDYLFNERKIKYERCDPDIFRRQLVTYFHYTYKPESRLALLPLEDWIREYVGVDWESSSDWEQSATWYRNLLP